MAAALARALVVTVSDGVFAGTRGDLSGPAVLHVLESAGFEVHGPEVVPDEHDQICQALTTAARSGYGLVMTTGGTGLGPRDVTPQATASILDYEVPGLAEHIRRTGFASTPMAVLSRGVAGVRERTLIVNLPGSQSGAAQGAQAVAPVIEHALQLLRGETSH